MSSPVWELPYSFQEWDKHITFGKEVMEVPYVNVLACDKVVG